MASSFNRTSITPRDDVHPAPSMDFLSNPMVISTAAFAIIVSLLGVQIFAKKMKKDKRKKKYHPIAGTLFNQLLNFHRLHHYMTDLAGKYRTYRLLSPFRNQIYTVDPANVEYILKTNFGNYGKVYHLSLASSEFRTSKFEYSFFLFVFILEIYDGEDLDKFIDHVI